MPKLIRNATGITRSSSIKGESQSKDPAYQARQDNNADQRPVGAEDAARANDDSPNGRPDPGTVLGKYVQVEGAWPETRSS